MSIVTLAAELIFVAWTISRFFCVCVCRGHHPSCVILLFFFSFFTECLAFSFVPFWNARKRVQIRESARVLVLTKTIHKRGKIAIHSANSYKQTQYFLAFVQHNSCVKQIFSLYGNHKSGERRKKDSQRTNENQLNLDCIVWQQSYQMRLIYRFTVAHLIESLFELMHSESFLHWMWRVHSPLNMACAWNQNWIGSVYFRGSFTQQLNNDGLREGQEAEEKWSLSINHTRTAKLEYMCAAVDTAQTHLNLIFWLLEH